MEVMPTSIQKESNTNIPLFKVLLVEDDPVLQRVHMLMLEKAGCEVYLAATGVEALEKVIVGDYRLILMDIGLPGMSGIEVAAEIRRRKDKNSKIKIIALTAFSKKEIEQACMDAGMNAVFTKPISYTLLCQITKQYIFS